MDPQQVTCYVHQARFPRASCHVHHEMPQAAGGSDSPDNLTWVCANCHNMVHRVADLIRSGRQPLGTDLALQYAPNDLGMRDRLLRLGGYAAEALLATTDGDVPGAEDQVIQVVLPRAVYARFKQLVYDHRVGGRRATLQGYLQGMVMGELRRAGMLPQAAAEPTATRGRRSR